ncbi:MAG: nucleotidyltransferase family protein [Clostridia bacterium]|nr:nucleotidyltransferase family protein [Clostridia bacterium]
MDEKEVQHILIEILYATVNEVENDTSITQKITPDILASIYRLAKRHDLAHIVSNFVYRNKIELDQELRTKLKREELMSVYRCEQMKYAFEEICSVFDAAKVAYIPLKGSVLRPYYPYESIRTSCDIDILIHEYDLDTAISNLQRKGYRCGNRHYHDVSLYSPNRIHLELHFNIQENMDVLDAVLKDAWQYATLTRGSRYDFRKDFFVFHMYAHMAYHFLSGGCGIRSLLDIWIMEHKMDAPYSCADVLLKKAGIYKFAVEMSSISNKCFTVNVRDAVSDLVLKYIYSGGVYGSAENNIAVEKSKTNSSVVYVLKRMFLPYKFMTLIYPILKKVPFLLPFCWVARWIKAIFKGKSKQIISEVSRANNISNNKIEEIKEIRRNLGL